MKNGNSSSEFGFIREKTDKGVKGVQVFPPEPLSGIIVLSAICRVKRRRKHGKTNEILSLFADADRGKPHASVPKICDFEEHAAACLLGGR